MFSEFDEMGRLMSLMRPQQPRAGKFRRDHTLSSASNSNMATRGTGAAPDYYNAVFGANSSDYYNGFAQTYRLDGLMYGPEFEQSSKRRKTSAFSSESAGRIYQQHSAYQNDFMNLAECKPSKYYNAGGDAQLVWERSIAVAQTRSSDGNGHALSMSKSDQSKFEDEEVVFMSRDDIEKTSPSRKDGINQIHETYLRYSYCSFLQNVGARLHL